MISSALDMEVDDELEGCQILFVPQLSLMNK